MSIHFFELSSPRDMLDKAKREADRMAADLNIDNLFNFFVTAYHVKDYIEQTTPALTNDVTALLQQPDFEMCQFLCFKGKHLKMTNKKITHQDASTHRRGGAAFGALALNTVAFNAGPSTVFTIDGQVVDIYVLAKRLIEAWDLLSVGRRGNFPAFSSGPGDAATPARRSADPGPGGE